MDNRDRAILAIGATGRQGGAVACHLLMDGWRVRTITRNPYKSAAKALAKAGVEVLSGSADDRASLDRAMDGVYGVFGMTSFWEHGYEAEVRHGKAIADAALAAGVEHLVFSTMGGTDRHTGVPHAESKWEVEQYIRERKLPATILRPVFFMDNLMHFSRPEVVDGVLTISMALRPDTRLQMIAVDDIGAFAALAFSHPAEYHGKAFELAGDELTMPQVAETLSRFLKERVRFVEIPLEQVRAFNPERAVMFEWFNEDGYHADIEALRALYPELMTFEKWLKHGGFQAKNELPETGVAAPA